MKLKQKVRQLAFIIPALLVLLLSFLTSMSADAASSPYIKTQNGELSFGTGDSSLTQSITAVDDQANAFILVWGTGGNQDIERVKFAASFNSDSEIQIDRGESGTAAKAAWQVVEADTAASTPAFSVQTGTISVGSGATTGSDTITAVTTGQSTVVAQPSCGSSDDTRQVQFRGSLGSTTQVDVDRSTSGSACTVRYWVVEWSGDMNVYNGSTANSGSSNTASIGSTINLSRSVLFMSWDNDTNGLAQHATRGYFSSTSQITFERETSTGTNTVEWSVVEFPSGSSVQADNGTSSPTLGTSGTTSDETISSVTEANTFYLHSQQVTGTGSAIVRGETIAYLTSTTNLRFEKQYTGQNSTWSYYVADLSGWTFNTGPDAPTLYNDDGGSNQIAFNNARQNDNTPIFRASATHTASFDTFELELNTQSDFGGTSYTEQFSGSYSSGTAYNLQTTGSLSLPTTDGVTYYARARASADSGSSWGDWSSGTWTFTYKSASEDIDWHQTTDEQFSTGTLSDTETTGSDAVQLATGGGGALSFSGVTSGTSAKDSGVTSVNTASISPSADTLLILDVLNVDQDFGVPASTPSTPTGPSGVTWEQVDTAPYTPDGIGARVTRFRAQPSSSPSSGAVNIPATQGQYTIMWSIYESNGDETQGNNGADAFVQTDTNNGTSGTASVTLSSFGSSNNVAIGGAGWSDSGGGCTAGSGFTEIHEVELEVNTCTLYTEWKANDNTVDVTRGSSNWGIIGSEIEEAAVIASGTITSSAVSYDSFDGATSWDEFDWSEDETNGSIAAQLYYTDSTTCDTVIPNAALSGNESGFSSGPVDISGLNTSTYDEICIRATLNDSGGSPILQDWTITWAATSNTAPDAPTSLVQRKIDDTVLSTGDWTDESSVEFTASATDTDNPENLQLCIEIDEVGTSFSNTEDSCGSAVAYSGSAVTVIHTISSLSDGTEYHWQARLKDDDNAYSSWVSYGSNAETARDVGVDTSAPTGGTVYDGTNTGVDEDFNNGSLSSLSANWDSFDASASGLLRYEYSIGTTSCGTDVVDWTSNSTTTSVTANSLTLNTSGLYYFGVRAVDNAGNVQSCVASDGQMVLPDLSFSLSSTSVGLDELNSGNSWTDTEITTLTTSTNAYNGYVVRAYLTDFLSSGASSIGDFTGGTYASPNTWQGSDTGFGYTSEDVTIQGASKFPTSGNCPGGRPATGDPCYAPFSQIAPGDIVADHTALVSGTPITNQSFDITYRVTVDAIQEALPYQTTIVYINTPSY